MGLFKGKGSVLDRGNYHGFKLTDQVLVARVIEKIIRECIVIDKFVFMPGHGTTELSSLSDNFKKDFWTRIKTFILLLIIRFSIEYHIKYYGGLYRF